MHPEYHSELKGLNTSATALVGTIVDIMRTNYCEAHIVEMVRKYEFFGSIHRYYCSRYSCGEVLIASRASIAPQ